MAKKKVAKKTAKKVSKKKVVKKESKKVPVGPKFKMGDIVTISPKSQYYTDDIRNPKDTLGVVYDVEENDGFPGHHPINVCWINGSTNDYRESDLLKAKAKK
jgi:hypothetical protein